MVPIAPLPAFASSHLHLQFLLISFSRMALWLVLLSPVVFGCVSLWFLLLSRPFLSSPCPDLEMLWASVIDGGYGRIILLSNLVIPKKERF